MNQEIFTALQNKLKVGNRRGVHLNAIPAASRYKFDIARLSAIFKSLPERFILDLLTLRNLNFSFSIHDTESTDIECTENFEESQWGDRLFCYHASFQEFALEIDEVYDLIISNPPFYTADYKTAEKARNTARFTDTLSFSELLEGVSQLLSDEGVFSVILPYSETEGFIALASGYGLFPQKITHTRGNATAELKRSMLLLSRKELSSYPIDVLLLRRNVGFIQRRTNRSQRIFI